MKCETTVPIINLKILQSDTSWISYSGLNVKMPKKQLKFFEYFLIKIMMETIVFLIDDYHQIS